MIHRTLDDCARSITETKAIEKSWELLTRDLQWSSVMTSKTLHFLCRALGFAEDGPVPVDNEVIRQRVWPKFEAGVRSGPHPVNWEGHSFEAYRRFMTAILVWADAKQWTTTELEATIFDEYKPAPKVRDRH
jgi:hypothetical protein